MDTEQVIIHHYPQSPVSEKVRVVLGIKGLKWKSVIIPRIPPKPNLMPLTGGYRLTPVMQIGSDVYCDTFCIIDEIEKRFPKPSLFPTGPAGLSMGIGQWTDGPLFKDCVTVALVEMSPNMPPEFLADRGPLYFGDDFSLESIKENYNHCLANVRTQFGWIDSALKSWNYISGDKPGLVDGLVYYLVWFLRDRMATGDKFLSQFENLVKWESEIFKIGHGSPEEMSDIAALDIAKNTNPKTAKQSDPLDPLGFNVGDKISIQPENGGPKVVGLLQSISPDRIAIMRHDQQVGEICVHFPRLGYLAKRV